MSVPELSKARYTTNISIAIDLVSYIIGEKDVPTADSQEMLAIGLARILILYPRLLLTPTLVPDRNKHLVFSEWLSDSDKKKLPWKYEEKNFN